MIALGTHGKSLLLIAALLLALILLPAAPAGAGDNAWTPLGPEGGRVKIMAIDPTDPATLYAGTVGSVFKSIDSGSHWTAGRTGLKQIYVYALAVDPVTPTTLYAGVFSSGVFKSIDGGSSWSPSGSDLAKRTVYDLAITPTGPTVVYAATNAGLFQSVDGGLSWTLIHPSVTEFIVVSPHSPTTLYTSSYKSSDGGQTWSGLGLSFIELVVHPADPDILFGSRGNNYIYKSTDGGGSWTAYSQLPHPYMALAIDPAIPDILYAVTSAAGFFKSTDGGETWSASGEGLSVIRIEALATHPAAPGTVYAGTYDQGVFKSTDWGDHWVASNAGFLAEYVSALAFDPRTPATLYAGTRDGEIFSSTDGGRQWSDPPTRLDDSFPEPTFVSSLVIDPQTPATLYAGTTRSAETRGIGLFKSIDGGNHWNPPGYIASENIIGLVLDPLDPLTLYMSAVYNGDGDLKIFKSSNGGESWVRLNDGCSISFGSDFLPGSRLAIDPANPATVYAGVGNCGVFKTTDGGQVWVDHNNGLTDKNIQTLLIDPHTPTTLYVLVEARNVSDPGGLFKSIDGGEQWFPCQAGLPAGVIVSSLALDPLTPETLYLGTRSGRVFKSIDGGQNWLAHTEVLPDRWIAGLAVHPLAPHVLYASVVRNGLFVFTQRPELSLSLTSSRSHSQPGQLVTYTVTISNSGWWNASDVVVSDTLPAGLALAGPVSLDPPQAGASTAQTPADLPRLAGGLVITPQTTLTLTFPVTVETGLLPGTTLTHTVVATDTSISRPAWDEVGLTVLPIDVYLPLLLKQ